MSESTRVVVVGAGAIGTPQPTPIEATALAGDGAAEP